MYRSVTAVVDRILPVNGFWSDFIKVDGIW